VTVHTQRRYPHSFDSRHTDSFNATTFKPDTRHTQNATTLYGQQRLQKIKTAKCAHSLALVGASGRSRRPPTIPKSTKSPTMAWSRAANSRTTLQNRTQPTNKHRRRRTHFAIRNRRRRQNMHKGNRRPVTTRRSIDWKMVDSVFEPLHARFDFTLEGCACD
jgi:hypothetical protein